MNTCQLLTLVVSFFLFIEAKGEDSLIIYPSADMWMGNKYSTTAQNGDYVRIGGWGDRYFGFWKFDWSEVDTSKEIESVVLYLKPDKARNKNNNLVTSATIYLLTTPWNEKKSKITDNLRGYPIGPFNISKKDGMVIDITALYEYWVDDPSMNYGILLYPEQNDNKYYYFPSRESDSDDCACAVVTYKDEVPDFKLPLPGGKEWVINTEIGDDTLLSHSKGNYYSIDFGPATRNGVESNVRVIASAAGVVADVGYQERRNGAQANGYYVIIDHDGDGDVNTGYQTRYLHLAHDPKLPGPVFPGLKKGAKVKQGQYIGIVGSTGTDAVHLHFGLRYKDDGSKTNKALSKIEVDGYRMRNFKAGSFYKSTNKK